VRSPHALLARLLDSLGAPSPACHPFNVASVAAVFLPWPPTLFPGLLLPAKKPFVRVVHQRRVLQHAEFRAPRRQIRVPTHAGCFPGSVVPKPEFHFKPARGGGSPTAKENRNGHPAAAPPPPPPASMVRRPLAGIRPALRWWKSRSFVCRGLGQSEFRHVPSLPDSNFGAPVTLADQMARIAGALSLPCDKQNLFYLGPPSMDRFLLLKCPRISEVRKLPCGKPSGANFRIKGTLEQVL